MRRVRPSTRSPSRSDELERPGRRSPSRHPASPASAPRRAIASRRAASRASASDARRERLAGQRRADRSPRPRRRREHLRVLALVVVGRRRQRHEHRRPSAPRSAPRASWRRRGRPRDRRRFISRSISIEERLDAGHEPRASGSRPGPVARSRSPVWCVIVQTAACGCQLRRCRHHGHVDRVRALGAAKDQNPSAARRGRDCRARLAAQELGTDRIARDEPLPPEVRARRCRTSPPPRCTNRASSRLVRPGHRVLLEQHRRDAAQRRQRARPDPSCSRRRQSRASGARRERIRHASSAAQRQQRQRRAPRRRSTCPSVRRCEAASSSNPSRGTTRASMPARRAGKRDPRVRLRAAAARARPRCPDTDARPCRRRRSRRASAVMHRPRPVIARSSTTCVADACCEMFSRMPMPSRLMSSDDPPELTNGSGMPLVGSSPSTTLMLNERLQRDHRRQADARGTRRTDPARASPCAARARR